MISFFLLFSLFLFNNPIWDVTAASRKTGYVPNLSSINPADIVDVNSLNRFYRNVPLKNYEIDWRYKEGIANLQIRNQGACQSCFAFSATEIYWSVRAMNGYQRDPYTSVQQILNCVPNPNSRESKNKPYRYSCDEGGQSYDVLTFLRDHKPALETQYPYANRNEGCKIKYIPIPENERIIQNIFAFPSLDLNSYYQQKYQPDAVRMPYETKFANEEHIAHFLYHRGPLVVAVDSTFFQNLEQINMPSIITADHCSKKGNSLIQYQLDKIRREKRINPNTPTKLIDFENDIFNMHEVVLVGLKQDPHTKKRYWILKVSYITF